MLSGRPSTAGFWGWLAACGHPSLAVPRPSTPPGGGWVCNCCPRLYSNQPPASTHSFCVGAQKCCYDNTKNLTTFECSLLRGAPTWWSSTGKPIDCGRPQPVVSFETADCGRPQPMVSLETAHCSCLQPVVSNETADCGWPQSTVSFEIASCSPRAGVNGLHRAP